MPKHQSKGENSTAAIKAEISPHGNLETFKKPRDFGFRNLPVQAKLSVGAVDDPLEYEADAVADKVMRMPNQSFIQRKCTSCEEEEDKLYEDIHWS